MNKVLRIEPGKHKTLGAGCYFNCYVLCYSEEPFCFTWMRNSPKENPSRRTNMMVAEKLFFIVLWNLRISIWGEWCLYYWTIIALRASLVVQLVENLPAVRETWVLSLDWEDPLEEGKVTHSSTLAWRIPWTVWSIGLQRVGHYWMTFTSNCSPPDFSVHGILQAEILKWVAISFSRGTSWPRNWTQISCIAGIFFTVSYESRANITQRGEDWLLFRNWLVRAIPSFCWVSDLKWHLM